MKMLCLDLFSGLGGFSEAFLDRGWNVIRIDNDDRFKDVPNTIIGNIRHLPLKRNLKPNILLMSPPCNCFSVASIGKYWIDDHIPMNERTVQALRLVGWALDAVDYLKPKYWVLENPMGMLRKILGKPKVHTYFASWGELRLKPTNLWGRFPPNMIWPRPEKWIEAKRGSTTGTQGMEDSNLKAKIPYKLSEAFCIAVENNGCGGLTDSPVRDCSSSSTSKNKKIK